MKRCSVCGAEVEAQVFRETVPSDWEYRYQAMLVWNFEPGTDIRHRCRLTPRRFTVAAEEVEEPVAPQRPQPEPVVTAVGPAAADGFIDD